MVGYSFGLGAVRGRGISWTLESSKLGAMKISAAMVNAYEFACNSKACAPPPAGTGGSNPSGGGGVAGGETKIKGGAVHSGGNQITGKITKVGDGYQATMRGKAHSVSTLKHGVKQKVVMGKTKAEVAKKAAELHDEARAGSQPATRRAAYAAGYGTSAVKAEKLAAVGKTSASAVKVGRDGSVKANGKDTGIKVERGGDGAGKTGWKVSGMMVQSGGGNSKGMKPKIFKTQAQAKSAVARQINRAVEAG